MIKQVLRIFVVCLTFAAATVTRAQKADPNASFRYPTSGYCSGEVDPTPNIYGDSGGKFSSLKSGIILSSSTGKIDLSASKNGNYQVLYSVPGKASYEGFIYALHMNGTVYNPQSYVGQSLIVQHDGLLTDYSINGEQTWGMKCTSMEIRIGGDTGTIIHQDSNPSFNTVGMPFHWPNGYINSFYRNPLTKPVQVKAGQVITLLFYGVTQYVLMGDTKIGATGVFAGDYIQSPDGKTWGPGKKLSTPCLLAEVGLRIYNKSDFTTDSTTVEMYGPKAGFNYSRNKYCHKTGNYSPIISGDSGGVFFSTPAGLNLDSTTGEISTGKSLPGNYTVFYKTETNDVSCIVSNSMATYRTDFVSWNWSMGRRDIGQSFFPCQNGVIDSFNLSGLTGVDSIRVFENIEIWDLNTGAHPIYSDTSPVIDVNGNYVFQSGLSISNSSKYTIVFYGFTGFVEACDNNCYKDGYSLYFDNWDDLYETGYLSGWDLHFKVNLKKAGCQVIDVQPLTINSVSDLTTSKSGSSITSNDTIAAYQWLDCNNNYAIIQGDTSRTFTATVNGNYAVELTEDGCVDTTACVAITDVGIIENGFGGKFMVYPNPTNGDFSIDLGENFNMIKVRISDIEGRIIRTITYNNSQFLKINIAEPSGIYLLTVESSNQRAVIRLVKE